MKGEKFEPNIFNTHKHSLKGHFESYNGDNAYENGEPEFDEVRQEIADHYGVPNDEEHVFIIDNDIVKRQRHQRAFCVLRRKDKEGKTEAWYIDGRVPHVSMLERLYNHYSIPDDDFNEKALGFLDCDEFQDIPDIQAKAKEQGKPITWFIRETISPSPKEPAF